MKNISKYDRTVRIDRIVHVVVSRENSGLSFEAVSAEPNSMGKSVVIPCTPEIYREVQGTMEGTIIKPKLRGDQRHAMLVRMGEVAVKGKEGKQSVAVAVDRIPLRFFAGASGPVPFKEARSEGFLMEWVEEHSGFKIDVVELGMNRRDLELMLEDVRKNMGNKSSYTTKCGRKVSKVDEVTLKVKNPKPFKERQI